MIPIEFVIERDESIASVRVHNTALKNAFREMGERHRQVVMGDHFKQNAKTRPGGEYGYEERSKRYKERKAKKGRTQPLVLTGKLRRETKARSKVTATKNGAKFVARAHFPLTSQRRKELEAMTRGEIKEAWEFLEQAYWKWVIRLKKRNTKRRKRIK